MIGIVNYGAGNLFSLKSSLTRLNLSFGMIESIDDVSKYSRIIIPGVGHAGRAIERLNASGLSSILAQIKDRPVLGICVGMQLMTSFSEEGEASLLGKFPMNTLHFKGRVSLKIPHMGWNVVNSKNDKGLFNQIPDNAYFYFVHSYFVEYEPYMTSAFSEYGITFSAAIQKDNFFGVQFHPEKSGENGERVLINFSKI